ncbi:hypothetical protein [Nocardioides sp. B-3]|uniref:hypothetical protein n=1 Tax=Nocardioides sp. B-3 TaxID=2895565 RepID=UPI0021537292|nr:hypothetical protein [Nocardioides sp. B-3]UUZ57989.1 hypothetical protein LP418_16845 [Nocardioides sp. B-3]
MSRRDPGPSASAGHAAADERMSAMTAAGWAVSAKSIRSRVLEYSLPLASAARRSVGFSPRSGLRPQRSRARMPTLCAEMLTASPSPLAIASESGKSSGMTVAAGVAAVALGVVDVVGAAGSAGVPDGDSRLQADRVSTGAQAGANRLMSSSSPQRSSLGRREPEPHCCDGSALRRVSAGRWAGRRGAPGPARRPR